MKHFLTCYPWSPIALTCQLTIPHTYFCWGHSLHSFHGFSSVQSLSPVWLFATPWIAARQASLSITNSYMDIWIYIQIRVYSICMCMYMYGIPRWCSGKESACQCRRCMRCGFDPWVWKRIWYLPPVFLPGKSHGQRSLAGYRVANDLMTKQL